MSAQRDWGHAKDYVRAMYLMMQQENADDYVIATGETNTIETFARTVCQFLDLKYEDVIKINSKFFRPAEVDLLVGDATKAKLDLNWEPSYTLKTLIEEMIEEELKYYAYQH